MQMRRGGDAKGKEMKDVKVKMENLNLQKFKPENLVER